MRYRAVVRDAWESRALLARGRWNAGFCHACGNKTVFIRYDGSLRDNYRCLRCGSIPRWRALMRVLEERFPDWRTMRVHEFAPGGAASRRLSKECGRYSRSFYDVPGEQREDLEALTFTDQSLDLIITQDVMEHVLDPEAAFREIGRVLKPGGAHVFTVPLYQRPRSVVRARRAHDGEVVEHLAPEYHQGPEGAALVATEWNEDIVDVIRQASGMDTDIVRPRGARLGLEAEFLEVFVSVQ